MCYSGYVWESGRERIEKEKDRKILKDIKN